MPLNPLHVQRLYELNLLRVQVDVANDITWAWIASIALILGIGLIVLAFTALKNEMDFGTIAFIVGFFTIAIAAITISCVGLDWNAKTINAKGNAWSYTRDNLREEATHTIDPQVP